MKILYLCVCMLMCRVNVNKRFVLMLHTHWVWSITKLLQRDVQNSMQCINGNKSKSKRVEGRSKVKNEWTSERTNERQSRNKEQKRKRGRVWVSKCMCVCWYRWGHINSPHILIHWNSCNKNVVCSMFIRMIMCRWMKCSLYTHHSQWHKNTHSSAVAGLESRSGNSVAWVTKAFRFAR